MPKISTYTPFTDFDTDIILPASQDDGAGGWNAGSVDRSLLFEYFGTEANVTIEAAAVSTLNSSPVNLVAAPGAGKIVQPLGFAWVKITYNSAAYATNTDLIIKYDGSTRWIMEAPVLDAATDIFAPFEFKATGPFAYAIENAALQVSVNGGDPTAGNSNIQIIVPYRIITV